jgi:tetratricopeptide (TPR) repeat protein
MGKRSWKILFKLSVKNIKPEDKIIITGWTDCSPWYRPGCNVYSLGELDLINRKVGNQRRFYAGPFLANMDVFINDKVSRNGPYPLGAPLAYEDLSKIPRRTKAQDEEMAIYDKVSKDTVPVNEYPAFLPFSRVTFMRYGIPFELRLSPRKISMVYKRADFESKTSADASLLSTFGKSELSVKDGDYKKASEYLNQCLLLVSPEDVNFRALIKQQFYKVYLELVRSAIRSNKPELQLKNALGMSNTASVLAEEVETLFALAESYNNNGHFKSAASCLRTLIEVYGQHEFPISSLAAKTIFYQEDVPLINDTLTDIFTEAKTKTGKIYTNEAS